MAQTAFAVAPPDEPIEYPESDGEPMGETDRHRDEIAEITLTLGRHFRAREDVYVSGNLFLYYEEGNPAACKAPDVFVVVGVPKKERRIYKLWEEGEVPTLVIEITSKKTKNEDENEKPKVYAEIGVPFLFFYDPYAEYLEPPLRGSELGKDGKYHRIPGPDDGPIPCRALGLDLFLDERGRLQFMNGETGDLVVRVTAALDRSEAALIGAEAARAQEKMARLQAAAALRLEKEARRQAEQGQQNAEDALSAARQEIERLRALLESK